MATGRNFTTRRRSLVSRLFFRDAPESALTEMGAHLAVDVHEGSGEMATVGKASNTRKLEGDTELTQGLEDTFPASDPVSIAQPHGADQHPSRAGRSKSGTEAELMRQPRGPKLKSGQHDA